jgi:hypothetical protein
MKTSLLTAASVCLVLATAPEAQKAAIRFITSGGGSGTALTASDLTLETALVAENVGGCALDTANQRTAFWDDGNSVRFFITQVSTGINVGKFSTCEFDIPDTPATLDTDYTNAPEMTFVENWGDHSDKPYDMYNGKFGASFNHADNLPTDGQSAGFAYVDETKDPIGIAIHESGGTRYQVTTFSEEYAIAYPSWNMIVTALTASGGTTSSGPYRTRTGVYPPGSGTLNHGPRRGGYMFKHPTTGTMCIGSGNNFTQQDAGNHGPSIYCGISWPTTATTSGYGTDAGGGGRSTDLVATQTYLGHGAVYGTILDDGTLPLGQEFWAFRIPAKAGNPPYIWEGKIVCTQSVPNGPVAPHNQALSGVNPAEYSNRGSYGETSSVGAVTMIDEGGSTKRGAIALMAWPEKEHWYRTGNCQIGTVDGVATTFDRNADERGYFTEIAGDNNDVYWQAAASNQHVTITYVDPATNNAALGVTVSGVDVTVNLATDGSSNPTSTADQVIAAVAAHGTASGLLSGSEYLGDGTGVVAAMSSLLLAHGPLWSPKNNVSSGANVTGPVSVENEMVLVFYDMDDLEAVNAGTQDDYEPEPTSVLYLKDDYPEIRFLGSAPGTTDYNNICGLDYIPRTNKLYMVTCRSDDATVFGDARPVVYRFGVDTAPTPSPIVPVSAGLLLLASLAGRARARGARAS